MIRSPRLLLALAAGAVGFAAADTYVVVMALPDMMVSAGISVDQLQRAAPLISGYLLGYVGILPLIGRVSDLRGRIPVLAVCMVILAVGSVVTAASYDFSTMVFGRFLQGIGGGGLIPPTLALVADLWPPHKRGLPLGIVGAVQELGAVIGPLFGAWVLTFGTWRTIFWINVAGCLVLAAAFMAWRSAESRVASRRFDYLGAAGLVLAGIAFTVVMLKPRDLRTGLTTGEAFIPVVGDSRWLTPLALFGYLVIALLIVWWWRSPAPLIDVRSWRSTAREVDVWGAAAFAGALACVVVIFSSADPQHQTVSDAWPWLVPLGLLAAALFVLRQVMARKPLVPRRSLTARPAWGALLVSFFVGTALIAALVDIPLFARITIHPDDQFAAALVLLQFLIALPVGAVLGGVLTRWVAPGVLTFVGMAMCAVAFWQMSRWEWLALEGAGSTIDLVVAGLGFGLAIAPVNAALLNHTDDEVHGMASGLLIVARMVGMLVGVSALTAIGLRRFHAASADAPTIADLCDPPTDVCTAYREALREVGLVQLQAVFFGAAVCAAIAAVLALVLLGRRVAAPVSAPAPAP